MTLNKALLSSKKDNWQTPREFFDKLNSILNFTLDPCANETNNLGLPRYYTKQMDGLSRSWEGERVFCNPPYGKEQISFVAKAISEKEAKTCLLIPARPDTKLWQDHILNKHDVLFLRGRLRFVGAKWPAPFPCALVFIHWKEISYDKNLFEPLFDLGSLCFLP